MSIIFILILIIILIILYYTKNDTINYFTILDNLTKNYNNFNTNSFDFDYFDLVNDGNKIPRIIIQTWKDENIPIKYKNDIESVIKFNPTYQYMFFTDKQIDEFLQSKYPDYWNTYQKLPIKIQRIDFFRYVAVYHYGGFYLDLDMECYKNLDSLLGYQCIFPLEQHIKKCDSKEIRLKYFCDRNNLFLLGQYAFGAEPKNKFLKMLIDTIHNNIDLYVNEYNLKINNNDLFMNVYVYQTTGPDFCTKIYMDYPNKNQIKIIESNKSNKFGDYAEHKTYGTWK